MARITFVLSCLVVATVLVSVDAGCDFYDSCGACVADSGCGWCSNDPKGQGSGVLSSNAGNLGKTFGIETNEGDVGVIGATEVPGVPLEHQLIAVRDQYKRVVSAGSNTFEIEEAFAFEGSGYLASPYFGHTADDVTRGHSIVGVHKTKFLTEMKAGMTITPYKQATYTVQSVQSDFSLTTSTALSSSFDHIEFQMGNYRVDGSISYGDTSKTTLSGSYPPNPTKFTQQLKDGYTISTGSADHSDANSPARVGSVVHDQLVILAAKFIATFENEPIWVEMGGRGTGLVSGTSGAARISGSNPCAVGYPCHPETAFLAELRVNDVIDLYNGTSTNSFTVSAILDDNHLQISECLSNGFFSASGVSCVGMGDDYSQGKLVTTTKFKIRSTHATPFTYARKVQGQTKSSYAGVNSRHLTKVQVSGLVADTSLTQSVAAGYAIVVRTSPKDETCDDPTGTTAKRGGCFTYERRMIRSVTSSGEVIVDRKFTQTFDNTPSGPGGTGVNNNMFHYESCPSLTYENFDDRTENGFGTITGTGASYTYDNTQYAEITSTDAQFEVNVRVGFEIELRNTGVKRRVTKVVSDTKIQVNRPFADKINGAPVGFSNHAWRFIVKKGTDKNGILVAGDSYDKKHHYGSDFFVHWKPKYNTGGSNSRQQGLISAGNSGNAADALADKKVYSHQQKSSVTSSGAGVMMQDPYLLYAPVCYNNGRCVAKTSHSHVGTELIIKDAGGTAVSGEIRSSSTSNAVHDLVNVGDTTPFYKDCKPACTVTAAKDGIWETRQVVGTVTAHNSTHMYTELPFSSNKTNSRSQYNNLPVPGFVPDGVTAYNALTGITFRVRYVTGTGTMHWCPNGDGAAASCTGANNKIVIGASKETKTKFHSETSSQWTITVPCGAAGENRTISTVASDTKLVVHDTFNTNQNKVSYCIGNIQALGRVTSPAGSKRIDGDDDTRFLEQLKVGHQVSIGNTLRTINAITSNKELTVNAGFNGGINTKSPMYFHGKVGTGEVSVSSGSTDVLGTLDVTQTKFNEELAVGYLFMVGRDYKVITTITSATTLTVDLPFTTMVHATSQETYGYYKNSYNYDSCFTYDLGDHTHGDNTPADVATIAYTTKHVYVEDACEIKAGCCGFKISSNVYPDKFAYYKIRPTHSNQNIRIVAKTTEDNIDLLAKKDSVPTTASYDYTSVRESNPWAISIPARDITCGEAYVGYNVSTTLGTQTHIVPPQHGTTDDTSTLDNDQTSFVGKDTYAPSNCSYFYIGVRGDNRYPQKTGASEYDLLVFTEFEFPNFLCSDASVDTTAAGANAKHACRYLGLTAVEDAAFVLNTDDSKAVMRLTPNTAMRKGSMWYGTKVHLFSGFEVSFEFRMSHFTVGCNTALFPSGFCGGGDGLAFLIHEKLDGDMDIGCHGAGLGFGTITAAQQGDDWARPRCITTDEATASQIKCDSGLTGAASGQSLKTSVDSTNVNALTMDNGNFDGTCVLMALCNPLDNGCAGTCAAPDCSKAISRVLAIEFDTWNNLKLHDPKQGISRWWINATEFVGYNDNHLAVFSSDSSYGTSTDHASPNHFAATPSIPNLADGKNHTVKVKYWPQKAAYSRKCKKGRGAPHSTAIALNGDCYDNVGATDQATRKSAPDACFCGQFENSAPGKLSIFIDDMRRPVLQTKISLLKGDVSGDCHDNDVDRCILDTQGNGYIGFSASTGGERIGLALDAFGVTETKHQTAQSQDANGYYPSQETAALMTGAAQRHEIINFKFCSKMGCVAV